MTPPCSGICWSGPGYRFLHECAAASRFESDRMLRAAVERKLIIIGEAAFKVSTGLRDAHPDVR